MQHQRNIPLLSVSQKIQLLHIKHPPAERNHDENEEEFIYQIVGDDEADINLNKISISSPIARALIGKSEGDVAEFNVPSGVREVEILEVIYDLSEKQ